MLAVSVLYLVTLGCLLYTTDAAVTAWTNPVISGANGTGTSTTKIPENQAAGATPVTINATTVGASKTYAITSQTTPGKLTITAGSGRLNLASGSTFDYETQKTYNLTITCVDLSDTKTGTATVILSITDVNDVSPVFAIAQYYAVSDGATAGTNLTSVLATDVDTIGNITYSISAGNTNNVFSISSSGVITVATGKTISKATTPGYTLTVNATDSATTAATTKVSVVVTAVQTCTCNSGTSGIISGEVVMLVVTIAFLFWTISKTSPYS